MGILRFIRKLTAPGHRLNDEDRQRAAILNSLRFENQRLKLERERALADLQAEKQQLQLERDKAKLEAEITEYAGDEEETGLSDVLDVLNKLNSPQGGGATASLSSPPNPAAVSLSDEEILSIWNKQPKQVKLMAKSVGYETAKKLIKGYMPALDDETINRAASIACARP